MPERARLVLDTKTTALTAYQDLLSLEISRDAKGLSYFSLGIDPDPKALYKIIIAKILNLNDLELTAIWTVSFEHLTSGVYKGFDAGDTVLVQHRSVDGTVIKTGVTLALSEVFCGGV